MRHHFVPQFLLRAWSEGANDGMFQEFRLDLEGLSTTRRVPKATAYQDNLYALTKPEVAGMSQQAIETDLMMFIDNYAAGLAVIALFAGACLAAMRSTFSPPVRTLAWGALVVCAVALAAHQVPWINNVLVFDAVAVSPAAANPSR